MSCAEVHQNDVGTVFEITLVDQDDVAVDVSGTDTKEIHFRNSSGTVTTGTAAFVTDGTDGKIKYTVTASTFLASSGTWTLQAYVHWADETQWYSELHKFQVKENLSS